MSTSMRPFRIENALRGRKGVDAEAGIPLAQLDRILEELSALRGDLAKASRAAQPASDATQLAPEAGQPVPDPADPETAKAALWQGVETIRDAIDSTKVEIASLHAGHQSGAKIDRASFELGAVVSDTEAATEVILSAAETIDALAGRLFSELSGPHQAMVKEIQDCSVHIFEACNFQDITGQRISKVVSLMQFIEHHVERMIHIWGGADEVQRVADSLNREREGDAALLNGPALATDHNVVSQDDIDSLFA
ncbi:protein phosphatase CheZ [Aquabacter sp. CN5-332]|uniref:protein phosphatase CheZ n=1 Tax=Aquabacter sp. CN5-332 TaxID=3156608 RepID=UPI0032B4A4E8